MQHTCKLAMAQMRMTDSIEENLQKSLNFCDEAADSDLLFFPEIQLSPFFPQYEKRNADQWCMQESAPEPESLVMHPSGDVIVKADDQEQLIRCELNLGEAREWREKVPYLGTRRPEWYL